MRISEIKGVVYKVTCVKNGRVYIGSTSDWYKRKHYHLTMLRHQIHKIELLRNDSILYNIEDFILEIIEECSTEQQLERENYWILYYLDRVGLEELYNKKTAYGKYLPGCEVSETGRQNISIAGKGKHDHRGEKNPMYGKPGLVGDLNPSKRPDVREKITKGQLKSYQEGRVSGFKGKKHTQEIKDKCRQANQGKIVSEETRRKMSESRRLAIQEGRVNSKRNNKEEKINEN